MIRQCCACHAIEILHEWVEYPEPIEGASHGYCPPCLAKATAEVDALEARSRLGELCGYPLIESDDVPSGGDITLRDPGAEDCETPMGEDVDG
jgi:hypothetical protein